MKVVTPQEMVRLEQRAYQEGASEALLMQRAGEGIAAGIQSFIARHHLKPAIGLLCGRGNNGGDAYVAGKLLIEGGFPVQAWALAPYGESSPLCQLQSRRFLEAGGTLTYIREAEQLSLSSCALLVDGLFGTGFHGPLPELYARVISRANQSKIPLIALDIPSGIDSGSGAIGSVAIHAAETFALGFPKVGCFLDRAWNEVGELRVYDIGLSEEDANATFQISEPAHLSSLLPPLVRSRNKYEAGYVVGWGGAPGMPGAPLLASLAALRAGAGIVRLLHPAGMEGELAAAPYELLRQPYHPDALPLLKETLQKASALFVGPGMGRSAESAHLLRTLLPQSARPLVLDADALTLIAQENLSPPPHAVLTPHHGEMKRLLGLSACPFSELVERSHDYAEKKAVTLVLKGAPTFIFHPGTLPFLSVKGTPGMATAGSGDVLTGILAAFLAQGSPPLEAALLAVGLHAQAGERATAEKGPYSLVASDLIEALPSVFLDTMRQNDPNPLRG